jgi:predicted glycosyltransferase
VNEHVISRLRSNFDIEAPLQPPTRGLRIALYSHDTMGLGHVRRNQLIARAFAAPPLSASVLLITGIREAGAFPVPSGIDSLSLPAYHKNPEGQYSARSLDMTSLQLTRLRADLIDMALERFEPDLFIVDNVPRGALDELVPALTRIAEHGQTRCVLGVRDILDDPTVVRREWEQRDNFASIRSFYDAVWIYGDPAVYTTAANYAFPDDIRAIARYTGYLDPQFSARHPHGAADRLAVVGDQHLCVAGGGQDGYRLASAFAEAEFPTGTTGLIVTGPFMARAEQDALAALATRRADLDVIGAVYDPIPLLRQSRSVVSMAGYNTVNEILSLGKDALLVPRTSPRTEQLIRAERLQALGLVDYVRDDALCGAAISTWLHRSRPKARARSMIDFEGLGRLPQLALDVIGTRRFDMPHPVAIPLERVRVVSL